MNKKESNNYESVEDKFAAEAAEAEIPGENEQPIPVTEIYSTDPEDEFSDEEFDNKPRTNYVTGTPEDELEYEGRAKDVKKTGMKKTIALTVIGVIVIFSIALFFIFRGSKDYQETANVRDNSQKLGINANASDGKTNFQTDYQTRYGENAGNSTLNANAAPAIPGYGSVGTNITAPPPPVNGTGGIFQPGQTTPGAVPPPAPVSPNNGGSSNGGSFSSGSSSAAAAPKTETTRIKPDKNTEVVEMPANQSGETANDERNNRSGSGRSEQVSLFFYDPPASSAASGRVQKIEIEGGSVSRPDFGTVLPIKVLGRLHTLGTNGLARMELTRAVEGSWGTLPRGTMFVGRVAGGEANRLFVSLVGYVDSRSNRLVTLGGDLQGKDGALGIEGDVKHVGSRWNKVFGDLFSTAKQVGTAYLLGKSSRGGGTIINNGQLAQLPSKLDASETAKFVLVPAGAEGYIVISDLPPAIESDERLAGAKKQLSDDEILKMVQTESTGDVQRIIPQLSPRGQQIARGVLER